MSFVVRRTKISNIYIFFLKKHLHRLDSSSTFSVHAI